MNPGWLYTYQNVLPGDLCENKYEFNIYFSFIEIESYSFLIITFKFDNNLSAKICTCNIYHNARFLLYFSRNRNAYMYIYIFF